MAALHSAVLVAQRGAQPSSGLPARWARIGGLNAPAACTGVVDLERLLVATAAAGDGALLDAAASWLAVHHVLVFGRRLATMATAIAQAPGPTAARLGELLDRAWAGALALPGDLRLRPENLEIARERCCPRAAAGVVRRRRNTPDGDSMAHRITVTTELPQPIDWVVQHVPELRVRALVGATLEAEILVAALASHRPSQGKADEVPAPSVAAVARHAGVSYAGVHGAANRLVRRGLLVRHRHGSRASLQSTALSHAAFDWPASAPEGV